MPGTTSTACSPLLFSRPAPWNRCGQTERGRGRLYALGQVRWQCPVATSVASYSLGKPFLSAKALKGKYWNKTNVFNSRRLNILFTRCQLQQRYGVTSEEKHWKLKSKHHHTYRSKKIPTSYIAERLCEQWKWKRELQVNDNINTGVK